MPLKTDLPTFESRLEDIAAAEQGEGWLSACEDSGRYLVPCRQLVASLAEVLGRLDADLVLEVCAGSGELAGQLREKGVPVAATDADPPAGSQTLGASAKEALRRHQPAVVLGSFVPIDAGVDELVMRCPSVRHYIVLGARIGGIFGSSALWCDAGWTAQPLEQVARWMLTRHDVRTGPSPREILRHGEAWHFRRA